VASIAYWGGGGFFLKEGGTTSEAWTGGAVCLLTSKGERPVQPVAGGEGGRRKKTGGAFVEKACRGEKRSAPFRRRERGEKKT